MIELFGWIGNLLFILGGVAFANKKRCGFILNILANISYIIVGIMTNITSLITISVVLSIINVYGLYKWRVGKKCVKTV